MTDIVITQLPPASYPAIIPSVAFIMQQCINEENVAFTYLAPASIETISTWWHNITPDVSAGSAIVFVAHDSGDTEKLLGCVILVLHQKPNAQHRADVQRLMVAKEGRGRGVGKRLMDALDEKAKSLGRTLLLLDTETGSTAEAFYLKRGYIKIGEVPEYLMVPNKTSLASESFFYKHLR